MKLIKKRYVVLSILLILLIGTVFTVYRYRFEELKEVNIGREFIKKLHENKMINSDENLENIKFKSEEIKVGNVNYYKLTNNKFGIDLDNNYRVIGFNQVSNDEGDEYLTYEEAKGLAKKYIKVLSEYQYMLDKMIKNDIVSQYYFYSFTRYSEGYPFYKDKITIN